MTVQANQGPARRGAPVPADTVAVTIDGFEITVPRAPW
jgi:hypothetical protein